MKLRIETASEQEEILIRCKERTPKIRLLEGMIENLLQENPEMTLYLQDTEYYIPKNDILFFETENGRVTAHTAERMFTTPYRLFELEQLLPPQFIRGSKSCILNIFAIEAIRRNLAGASTVFFKNCPKQVYVSRGYFKPLQEKIHEMRFLQ